MSPRNPVQTLHRLCIKSIRDRVVEALSKEQNLHISSVEQYLSEVTYEVLQDLLQNILSSEHLDAATRFNCLRVLLRGDVRKLSTGIFPNSYYEAILEVIKRQGTGLHHLNLKGVWARDHSLLLTELVQSLTKLRVLVIPHMPDDQVLEAITSCSRHLTVLDISGECSFTTRGLGKLRCPTLKVLEIGNYGKKNICCLQKGNSDNGENDEDPCNNSSEEVLAELIGNLPELTHLNVYSFVGSTLLLLQQHHHHNKNKSHKTKLKHLHDTGTTLEVMEAIVNMCPNLESIHLDTPATGVIARFEQLSKLNTIKLTRTSVEEILEFFQRSGDRCQILKLTSNKSSTLDLSQICLCAPNLLKLELFQMKLTFGLPDTYFMALEDVELLYCDISESSLKFILLNCPMLKRFVVGCAITWTDGDIFRLCAECDFVNLEELWISCARSLTCTAVELLMGHCPNLKVLGQLSGWDIHQEEVDFLRSVIIFTNTNLTLLPHLPF